MGLEVTPLRDAAFVLNIIDIEQRQTVELLITHSQLLYFPITSSGATSQDKKLSLKIAYYLNV